MKLPLTTHSLIPLFPSIPPPPSFINPGHICYSSAVLQSLIHCLLVSPFPFHLPLTDCLQLSSSFTHLFLVSLLNRSLPTSPISAIPFLSSIPNAPFSDMTVEMDASVFFKTLALALLDEADTGKQRILGRACRYMWTERMWCPGCGSEEKKKRWETFKSVPFPKKENEGLKDIMKDMLQRKKKDGRCGNDWCKAEHMWKQDGFGEDEKPFIFVVQVNRNKCENNTVIKITKRLKLEESLWIEGNENEEIIRYELMAVVRHLGNSSTTGHYVSDVRYAKEEIWYVCDDEYVGRLNDERIELQESQAYMFFYVLQ